MKTLSVIIPTYNTSKEYFSKCLASLVCEQAGEIEIVVIDDGSMEQYSSEIKQEIEKSPLDIYYCKKKNGGQNSAREYGLVKATAQYVFFIKMKKDRKVIGEIVGLSATILLGCIADQIFWKTDQVILGKLFSTAVVAVYSVGAQIYMMYMQFGTQIASIFYPKVSILYQEENGNQKVSDLFVRIGRVTFMVIMLILSGFIVFGKEFLLIWVGEGYTEAYYVAVVVMIPFSIDLAQNLALAILQVKKQYGFRAKIYLLSALINVVATVILASYFGIVGAAISTGMSMSITSGLIMNWYYLKKANLDIVKFWKESFEIIAASVLMTILTLWIKRCIAWNATELLDFGLGILLFVLIYAGVMYRFIMTSEEKKQILAFLKQK